MKTYKEERPWGVFERFTLNEFSTVKILTVKPGESLSLQSHQNRDEFWRIISGSGTVTIGHTELPALADKEFFIPKGTLHKMTASDTREVKFLEIALGEFDERDEIRMEDKYGRD
jgi:mannose-6-phosphate isomerase-like protein (cupin superfamily)